MPYANLEDRRIRDREHRRLIPPKPRPTALDRLKWLIVEVGDCWLWRGSLNNKGYGWFRWNGRTQLAHRASFILHGGVIPEGMELDHLCRTPHCVRPDHLEPVSHRENMHRGTTPSAQNARMTKCRLGHDFSPSPYPSQRGKRLCLICERVKIKQQNRDRRAATVLRQQARAAK